jgi:uncharacterized membrane protein YjgN (DUF898 family)
MSAVPSIARMRTDSSFRFSFAGRGGTLLGIYLLNMVGVVFTLGVYTFWAKVRVRRYLFGQLEVAGERLEYHGLGGELLRGALKAALVFGLPLTIVRTLPRLIDIGVGGALVTWILSTLFIGLFLPVARVGARRYRLSRTSWRGIRFSFRGQPAPYVRIFLQGWCLTILTLGMYYPVYAVRSHAYMVAHSTFGSATFDFDGDGTDLLLDWVYALLLTLPTFGFVWFWFGARRSHYLWAHTTLAGARFDFPISGGELMRLRLGNAALLLLSLGVAYPWTVVRNARFTCARLSLDGNLDLTAIRAASTLADATGEGVLGLLEADLDWA